MAKDLPDQNSVSPKNGSKFVSPNKEIIQPEDDVPAGKKYYFNNALVERLLYQYVEGACTDVKLRDEVMSHASELIRQIIRANNLHTIYPGRDDSSFGDLFQVAWAQIESVLYKYEAAPHCLGCFNKARPQDSLLYPEFRLINSVISGLKRCPRCNIKLSREVVYYKGKSKVFNMWSQVARTVALAHIKRESRDRKNFGGYQSHLVRRTKPRSYMFGRFLEECREAFKYNDGFLSLIEALEKIHHDDDRAHEGLIAKLVKESGRSRAQVTSFLKMVRLRSFEFSDAPVDEKPNRNLQNLNQKQSHDDEDE